MEAGIFDGQAFGGGGGVERLIRRNRRYRREARKSMIALSSRWPATTFNDRRQAGRRSSPTTRSDRSPTLCSAYLLSSY